jgi:hypothetical protein
MVFHIYICINSEDERKQSKVSYILEVVCSTTTTCSMESLHCQGKPLDIVFIVKITRQSSKHSNESV